MARGKKANTEVKVEETAPVANTDVVAEEVAPTLLIEVEGENYYDRILRERGRTYDDPYPKG